MAVQVSTPQKKDDDQLLSTLTKVGSDVLMKKISGFAGDKMKKQAGAEDDVEISNGVYSGSDSNPRDRRMNRGY